VDTAGLEEFKSVRDSSILNKDGYVFVFDVKNLDTLSSIDHFLHAIKPKASKVPLLIVGNKHDSP